MIQIFRAETTVDRIVMRNSADLRCGQCGYGIVDRAKPVRCPMCGCDGSWVERPGQGSRQADAPGGPGRRGSREVEFAKFS